MSITKGIYQTKFVAMECATSICKEERRSLEDLYQLQGAEQVHHQKQLPIAQNRWFICSTIRSMSLFQELSEIGILST